MLKLKRRVAELEAQIKANEKKTADCLFALNESIADLQDKFSEMKETVTQFSSESEEGLKLEQTFLAGLNGIMTYGVENGRKE